MLRQKIVLGLFLLSVFAVGLWLYLQPSALSFQALISRAPMSESTPPLLAADPSLAEKPDSLQSAFTPSSHDLTRTENAVGPNDSPDSLTKPSAAEPTTFSSIVNLSLNEGPWSHQRQAQWRDLHRQLKLKPQPQLLHQLLQLVQSGSQQPEAEIQVVKIMGDTLYRPSRDWLLSRLALHHPLRLRSEALLSLAQLGENVEEFALANLGQPSADLRESSLWALALVGSTQSVTPLQQLLPHLSSGDRTLAKHALVQIRQRNNP